MKLHLRDPEVPAETRHCQSAENNKTGDEVLPTVHCTTVVSNDLNVLEKIILEECKELRTTGENKIE